MIKLIEQNKRAFFDYFIEETLEAGIVLSGSEVKSIKMGHVSLKESFCRCEKGEMLLKNCFVAAYKMDNEKQDERRDRKLLLHKKEISRLIGKINEKGYTLLATKIYFKDNLIKLELGLGKGKHFFEKKQTIKERDIKREAEREISRYNR
jgi:SsrA-binding protein